MPKLIYEIDPWANSITVRNPEAGFKALEPKIFIQKRF